MGELRQVETLTRVVEIVRHQETKHVSSVKRLPNAGEKLRSVAFNCIEMRHI